MSIKVIDSSSPNPLAKFISSTYTLSLYMIEPTKLGSFEGDSRVITRSNGYYLIAQSGGSDKNERLPVTVSTDGILVGNNRHEFFIDSLTMNTIVNTKQSQIDNNPVSYGFRLKIIEPLGASFFQMLRSTFDYIKRLNPNMGLSTIDSSHFLGQLYGLKISFHGYDIHGNIVRNAVKDIFYTLKINSIKSKFDGRTNTYDIEAVSLHDYEGNAKYATVPTNMTVVGATVQELMNDFSSKLNQYWQAQCDDIKKNAEIQRQKNLRTDVLNPVPNTFEFDFSTHKFAALADSTFAPLGGVRQGASKTVTSTAKTPSAANAKLESDPSSKTVNRTLYSENIVAGTKIYTAISTILSKSLYISEQLDQIANREIESEQKSTTKPSTKQASYYSVIPVVAVRKHDNTKNEYALNFKYVFVPFAISYSTSNEISNLHSPILFRRYSYAYTGKNTEIKSFELNMDNTYYLTGSTIPTLNELLSTTTTMVGTADGGTPNNPTTSPNSSIISNFIANFSDPGAKFSAKLSILGDPGYLIADPRDIALGKSTDVLANSPFSRAAYFDVRFNVGIDYNYDTGLLDVSNKMKMNLLQTTNDNNGMVFMVTTVTSNFHGGEFTQDLQSVPIEGTIII